MGFLVFEGIAREPKSPKKGGVRAYLEVHGTY